MGLWYGRVLLIVKMKGVFSAPGDYIHFKSQVPLHKIPVRLSRFPLWFFPIFLDFIFFVGFTLLVLFLGLSLFGYSLSVSITSSNFIRWISISGLNYVNLDMGYSWLSWFAWALVSMFWVNFMVSDRHGFVFVGPFL